MGSMPFSIATVGYALVLASNVAYLAYLLRRGFLRGAADRATWCFAAALATTSAWGLAAMMAEESRVWWWPGLAIGLDLLRYGCWLAFLLSVLYPSRDRQSLGRPLALLSVGIWCLAAVALSRASFHRLVADRLVVAGSLALAVIGLVLLEQVFRNQTRDSSWNVKPMSIGLGFGFAFDVFVFSEGVMFGRLDDDALAVRGAVHALATPLLFVASQRHAAWIRRMQLSRSAVFYSATLLLIGVYLLFIAGVGYYVRYFGGTWGRALQLAVLAMALLGLTVVVVSGTLRARLRVFLGKHFFSYRFDYRQEWLRFTDMMSTPTAPHEVGSLVVRGLADMVECPAGSLWSQELGGGDFVQTASWNMAAGDGKEPVESSLCTLLREREWIVDIDEFRSQPRRYGDLVLPLWMATHPTAWLVVPLLVGTQMIGFVILAKPRTAVDLNWEVRDLLKTAARQAAVFLSQMHATEALLEARKFDAFNRMSAFVVHDLKNIITQLSLMLKNAQRLGGNPEFQQDMLLTVESSLEKMRQLMTQLREGQKPIGNVAGVDLTSLVLRLQAAARSRGREIEVEIVDRIATRGHEQRLERVLGHVVQNALDATPPTGKVWVRLMQDGGRVKLLVGDTGAGMSAEFVQTQLFRPFNSTKDNGMGIGSYESYQYIKELGGSIAAESEVGKGSIVTILVPLFDSRTQSDLTMSESA